MKISIFWFRRDLRLEDNVALSTALESGLPVLPLFIFDTNIVDELPVSDARITFIYQQLQLINNAIKSLGASLLIKKGDPITIWKQLIASYDVQAVYINKDYEPYAIERDNLLLKLLSNHEITANCYKDQVIFEESEIVKSDGAPYTIFTPYKNKWLASFNRKAMTVMDGIKSNSNFFQVDLPFPTLSELGFKTSKIEVKEFDLSQLNQYAEKRNIPADDATSYLSVHLRFGTVSIRQVISLIDPEDELFLSELIWREFFMQILFHFPRVVNENFKVKYNDIQWRNNELEFKCWCKGETGYPLVDAGMRQLLKTGYMHNRVRMVVAGFLCKHLLIDWKWGEAFFASKLLDYELSSNNGNWQWSAGTGCDAAPYFRIFNPISQQQKFDKDLLYVKKWVPEFGTSSYPVPMVDNKKARMRAIERYKQGLKTNS